ncbi:MULTISPECIES: glycosyltransferase family 2 protein [Parabacteroides]|uniref:glycosyltransferase family 2 protein n=1 Tax=Parabacteroides leei TaxID=2939491 RepID=UPI001E517DEB|nr:glycosyltransferase family 2 protein [Parabacteroides goldsteinii]
MDKNSKSLNKMVSIITINYNGYKETCELIESFHRVETYPYELIVVDNASKEDEGKLLKEKYPDIIAVYSDKNLGFAGGNNLGYQYATGEYILYINNDITIAAPFLQILIYRLISSPLIGVVSPKIKYEYQPDIIQYAGFTPMTSILLKNRMIGEKEKDNGQYDQPCHTGFAHGACMLTSRNILKEVGTMTEVYFLFYEEMDWGLQLQRAGYESWYEPAATVLHKESMTAKRNSPLRTYYMTRSRILFVRRNSRGFRKLLAYLYILLISTSKNVFCYLIKRQTKILVAFLKGTIRGFTDNSSMYSK